jgi:hypothetical protein
MINGRFNIYLGLLALVVATIAGFALGQSLEPFYKEGYGQISLWRYLTKAGHTHGMSFGLINVVFGLLLGRSEGSASLKHRARFSPHCLYFCRLELPCAASPRARNLPKASP